MSRSIVVVRVMVDPVLPSLDCGGHSIQFQVSSVTSRSLRQSVR
jgi:hypothetical protein